METRDHEFRITPFLKRDQTRSSILIGNNTVACACDQSQLNEQRQYAQTEHRTYLIMHTGGGTSREGRGKGIHWHIENKVEYVTVGEHKQVIPWVRVTFQDGTVREYLDAANPIASADLAAAPRRVMDCVDCHNRMGHPFPDPGQAVDEAMALGRIDRSLPGIKAWAMELIEAESGPQAIRLVEEESPDAVLLDIKMPRMDGLEVLAELRSPAHACVRLIWRDQTPKSEETVATLVSIVFNIR